jgi:aldose 1-epimerase
LLTLIHRADAGWPWPFEARQRVTLGERELTLDLIAVNTAARPVPLSFGMHPYFPQSGASLRFAASAVWLAGEDGLPRERVEPHGKFDFSSPMPVEQVDLDNCYTDWSEPACITWAGQPLGLEVSASRSLPAAVVYVRSDAQGFCFEPVAHINNALNLPGRQPAMPIIAPGAAFRATVRLRAVPRDAAVRRSPGERG